MKPKQRRQAIANELGWLAAGVDHRLRCCLQETIDQEYDIEWQARLGQPGRATHVDEHADDIALFTDVDALPIADQLVPFLCECADGTCLGRVDMKVAEYDEIHADRNQYSILHDHELANGEAVIEERALFDIVSKDSHQLS